MNVENIELEEIFSYYNGQKDKASQEMVVALLRELQDVEGCLTPQLIKRVTEITGVAETFLQCLIKMYPSLKCVNVTHEIIACTGERCTKKEGLRILERLKKELKPDQNGISADGRFQLRTRNCLKQCKSSPNILIDGVLYSGEKVLNISRLLNEICETNHKNTK